LLLAACGASSSQNPNDGLPSSINENQTEGDLASTPSQLQPTLDPSPDAPNQVILPNVNVAPYPEPTGAPEVKTELEASDPATVTLASGKPQLVEFFAFW
jgi:hypothetical protein